MVTKGYQKGVYERVTKGSWAHLQTRTLLLESAAKKSRDHAARMRHGRMPMTRTILELASFSTAVAECRPSFLAYFPLIIDPSHAGYYKGSCLGQLRSFPVRLSCSGDIACE